MSNAKQFEFLKEKFEAGKLGHAYIFSGHDLESVKTFAKEFSKYINCLGDKKLCNECQNCKLLDKNNFPDVLVIKSENSKSSQKEGSDMMEIDVNQIRGVQDFLQYKSYYGGYKVVIVENADRMNLESQACFLKTLEEPKGKTLIILLTTKHDALLPTIASRCQSVKFFGSKDYTVQDQQVLQDILPVIQMDLAEKFKYTKNANLESGNAMKIVSALQRHFRNILLAQLGVSKNSGIAPYSIGKLRQILVLGESIMRQLSTTNVNPKLALEILLLEI